MGYYLILLRGAELNFISENCACSWLAAHCYSGLSRAPCGHVYGSRIQDILAAKTYMKMAARCKLQKRPRAHRITSRRNYTKKRMRCEPQTGAFVARAHRTTPRRNYTKKMTKREPQTRPAGAFFGLHTKDRTNEKGKQKSEKHSALCEVKHRKTKKKKTDTKSRLTEA